MCQVVSKIEQVWALDEQRVREAQHRQVAGAVRAAGRARGEAWKLRQGPEPTTVPSWPFGQKTWLNLPPPPAKIPSLISFLMLSLSPSWLVSRKGVYCPRLRSIPQPSVDQLCPRGSAAPSLLEAMRPETPQPGPFPGWVFRALSSPELPPCGTDSAVGWGGPSGFPLPALTLEAILWLLFRFPAPLTYRWSSTQLFLAYSAFFYPKIWWNEIFFIILPLVFGGVRVRVREGRGKKSIFSLNFINEIW